MASSNGHDPSVSELEREAERNRAALIDTVDALHHRMAPQALKADVRDYVRHTGQDLFATVQQRARDNPMQAVAIAAGLAFPLWRIVSAMPVPLLLIGAGLALTRSGGRSGAPGLPSGSIGSELYEQTREKVDETVGMVRERVHDAANAVQQKVDDASGRIREAAQQFGSGMQQAKEAAAARVGGVVSGAHDLGARAAAVPSELYGGAVAAAGSGLQGVERGAGQLRQAAYDGAHRMGEAGHRAGSGLMESIESHPLMAGAIGLAAGAAFAAALPSTRTEGRLFGEASDDLRERAAAAASEGADSAWSAANDAYDEAVREARAQGLTPDALREAVRNLAETAKSVSRKAAGASAATAASIDEHR